MTRWLKLIHVILDLCSFSDTVSNCMQAGFPQKSLKSMGASKEYVCQAQVLYTKYIWHFNFDILMEPLTKKEKILSE